jgi:hypothetical protein
MKCVNIRNVPRMIVEAAGSSETEVNSCSAARRHIKLDILAICNVTAIQNLYLAHCILGSFLHILTEPLTMN